MTQIRQYWSPHLCFRTTEFNGWELEVTAGRDSLLTRDWSQYLTNTVVCISEQMWTHTVLCTSGLRLFLMVVLLKGNLNTPAYDDASFCGNSL